MRHQLFHRKIYGAIDGNRRGIQLVNNQNNGTISDSFVVLDSWN